MKKRIAILLVTLALICGALTGCSSQSYDVTDTTAIILEEYGFHAIPGENDLVYDMDTRQVFYLFCASVSEKGSNTHSYSFFGQYVNENGKTCKYIGGEFVENL